ncbi:MAG: cysteine hydrolase [Bifidobacteriaceae bacterium]|jgi:nicotinamidase-related amidase|nr:cysteine hydrolase [Bifidobacteriaceae bacterium]
MKQIPAQPYPYPLPDRGVALICIDFQRDFVEPGGFGESLGNDVTPLGQTIEPTRRVLDAFRRAGRPVIHTREGHRADLADLYDSKRDRGNPSLKIGEPGPMGRLLVRGEPGHQIVEALAPAPGEPVIDKSGKDAFYGTDLDVILHARGITHLVFTGVTTEVCVQSTMREANDRGYECLLLADCTASYFPDFYRVTLEEITAQGGIVGWVATSGDLIAQL